MGEKQQENWNDVMPYSSPSLPPEGKTLVKIEAPYQTAVMVQRPRDIDKIQKAVLRESEYAGEDFFYSWTVKGKKGPQTIQGPSIGLAMCVAREWTNCAVDVNVEPAGPYEIFTASFIDLERGFTAKRAFKQRKTLAPGRYDAERWEDMEFQKAQSKAIRNVIVSGVPRWLVNQAIEKAKQAVLDKISKQGIEAATQRAIQFLGNYGISEDRIIVKIGKPKNEWSSEDILMLRGCASELKDGQVSADELFPPIKQPTKKPDKPEKTPKNDQEGTKSEAGTEKTKKPGHPNPQEETGNDPDDAFIDEFRGLRKGNEVDTGLKPYEVLNLHRLIEASQKVQMAWEEKYYRIYGVTYDWDVATKRLAAMRAEEKINGDREDPGPTGRTSKRLHCDENNKVPWAGQWVAVAITCAVCKAQDGCKEYQDYVKHQIESGGQAKQELA